jgi:hypothetical protein
MTRSIATMTVLACVLMAQGAHAWGDPPASASANSEAQPQTTSPRWDAAASARYGLTLPSLVAPGSLHTGRVTVTSLGGYERVRSSAIMRSYVDARLFGRLDVRAGVTYLPNYARGPVQPYAGLRLRLLDQDTHGVDLALGAFYRSDRFPGDDGFAELLVALGKRFGRLGTFANLTYGQDFEGDDFAGTVSIAALYELVPQAQLGFESRINVDLGSNDPRRKVRKDPDLDGHAGALLTYAWGPVSLLAQGGASAMRVNNTRIGAFALTGLSAAY